ncbi:MAG TPA: cobalamin-binding protein [Gaiellales bacterium]|jgi:iron complex transport system substrate-binding protein
MGLRICSLLPSATEIVAVLGLEDLLVGVSEECDWPPSVRELPVVTRSRIDFSTLSSREIDRGVREAVRSGDSLYALDAEQIDALSPDLVITQDLCRVCAVSSGEVDRLCDLRAEVVSLDPHTIAEIGGSVLELAALLEASERGREVVSDMERRIAAVREAVAGRPRPEIFVCEWADPPFAAGHWVPEMVEAAGGRDVLGVAGRPSYTTTWDDVLAADPSLVVLACCGFDAARAAQDANLPALPMPVVAVDANAYYSRPSPRVAAGVEQLAHLMHPDAVADPGLPAIWLSPSDGGADGLGQRRGKGSRIAAA